MAKPPKNESRLLRSREAADYLSLSPRKLWELQARGIIPVVRDGRLLRFDRRDLDAWVEARKTKGGQAR